MWRTKSNAEVSIISVIAIPLRSFFALSHFITSCYSYCFMPTGNRYRFILLSLRAQRSCTAITSKSYCATMLTQIKTPTFTVSAWALQMCPAQEPALPPPWRQFHLQAHDNPPPPFTHSVQKGQGSALQIIRQCCEAGARSARSPNFLSGVGMRFRLRLLVNLN